MSTPPLHPAGPLSPDVQLAVTSLAAAVSETSDPGTLRQIHTSLRHLLVDLDARLDETSRAPAECDDRAVGLDEACALLGMDRSYLERRPNWARLGGYKDADRRVKFTLSALRAHLRDTKTP
jgi:hypothetical protein